MRASPIDDNAAMAEKMSGKLHKDFENGVLDAYGFKYSKGSIQIPYSDELPLPLISEIPAWCRDTGNHARSEERTGQEGNNQV